MNIPLLEKRLRSLEETVADLKATLGKTSLEMRDFKEEALRTKYLRERLNAKVESYSEAEAREEADRLQERRDYYQIKVKMALKYGYMVEDLVEPIICDILRRWFDVPSPYKCSTSPHCSGLFADGSGRIRHFDLIADCGDYTVVNKTSYSLDPSNVPRLMDTIQDYRECQPPQCRLNLIGCLAALKAEVSLIKYASAHGILVLAVGDGLMDVMNDPGFKPRIF
jgi:hypothetical protein